jgi:histone-lysine N-methyltransferase SETMAR
VLLLLAIEGNFEGKTQRKITMQVLFSHDNTPTHRALATQKKLVYLGFQYHDHPPYFPDLAPSDYHLVPGLKNQFEVRHFSSDEEVHAATETWLDGQKSEIFLVVCNS